MRHYNCISNRDALGQRRDDPKFIVQVEECFATLDEARAFFADEPELGGGAIQLVDDDGDATLVERVPAEQEIPTA